MSKLSANLSSIKVFGHYDGCSANSDVDIKHYKNLSIYYIIITYELFCRWHKCWIKDTNY